MTNFGNKTKRWYNDINIPIKVEGTGLYFIMIIIHIRNIKSAKKMLVLKVELMIIKNIF